MGDDYGYFGSGSSGYAHYQQTFKSCFGGSGGSGGGGGNHNNEPNWGCLVLLMEIGVLILVPLYWILTALQIAYHDLAGIEPITILIDLFGTPAFVYVVWRILRFWRN